MLNQTPFSKNPYFFSKSVLFHHPQYAKYDKLNYGLHLKNAYYSMYDDNCNLFYKYFQGWYPWTKSVMNKFNELCFRKVHTHILRIKGMNAVEITQKITGIKKISDQTSTQGEVVCVVTNLDYMECCALLANQQSTPVEVCAETIMDNIIVKVVFQASFVSIHRIMPTLIHTYDEFKDLLVKYDVKYCVPQQEDHLKYVYKQMNEQLTIEINQAG